MYFAITVEPLAACPYWFWTVSAHEEIIPHSLFMICTLFPPNFNMDLHVTLPPTTYPPLLGVVTWASFRNVSVTILSFYRIFIQGCVTEVYLTKGDNYYRLITYLIRDLA